MDQERQKLQEKYDRDTKSLEENAKKREQQLKNELTQKMNELEKKHKNELEALRKDLDAKHTSAKKVVPSLKTADNEKKQQVSNAFLVCRFSGVGSKVREREDSSAAGERQV